MLYLRSPSLRAFTAFEHRVVFPEEWVGQRKMLRGGENMLVHMYLLYCIAHKHSSIVPASPASSSWP